MKSICARDRKTSTVCRVKNRQDRAIDESNFPKALGFQNVSSVCFIGLPAPTQRIDGSRVWKFGY